MNTPIQDFLRSYAGSAAVRFHMPGHKGRGPLGCENWDITEIAGADSLYEANGIIAESEANATALFGSGRTLYSTEGSSQCIRAMLYLARLTCPEKPRPVILAARNVHKAFLYAAAALDLAVSWLWPESDTDSLCACPVTPGGLERALSAMEEPPAAVYITSPDYLGGMTDIEGLAGVCHAHGTLLLVDNAHGAYLRFLRPSRHPMDLGADACCDSAHKTLPALTGAAYLHIGKGAPALFAREARQAMALFGSTSPSYLILASLDGCNGRLAGDYPRELGMFCRQVEYVRSVMAEKGWRVEETDPLRITLAAPAGLTGLALADALRQKDIECEYADGEYAVLMLTPANTPLDLARLCAEMEENTRPYTPRETLVPARCESVMTIRQALFSPGETLPAGETLNRICRAPTVACPPAIPIAVPGERIGPEALALFARYGIDTVDVVQEKR